MDGRTIGAAARDARLVLRVTAGHLRDEPAQLAALAAQRLPQRAVQRLALAVLAIPGGRGSSRRALALLVTGSGDLGAEVSGRLAAPADASCRHARRRRRLAFVMLAAGRADLARRLLESLPAGTPGRARLAARCHWADGELRAAIDEAGLGADGSGRRLRARYASELAILDGSTRLGRAARRDAGMYAGRAAPRRPAPRNGTILHLVTNSLPYTRSGYTVRTQAITAAQRDVGFLPIVVTRLGYPATVGRLARGRREVVGGIPHLRLLTPTLPGGYGARLELQLAELARVAERVRPALLHTTTHFPNGLTALALGERLALPVVYEVRGFLEETWLSRHGGRGEGSELYCQWRARETECMRRADLVVTLAEVMKAEIVGRGIPADKVIVVPNGVDASFLAPAPDPRELRERLGFRDGEIVIGTVTSVVPYEGLDTLLRALALLHRSGTPVRGLVVGDGTARAGLEQLSADLGLAGVVSFTGRVPAERVREHHAAIDIFALPRRDDRVCQLVTPLKPFEAMATGRPVVASDLPALREVVTDGRTGMIVPPEDPAALAVALSALVDDGALRSSMGRAAREMVAATRTWVRAAETYRTAYRSLGVLPSRPERRSGREREGTGG